MKGIAQLLVKICLVINAVFGSEELIISPDANNNSMGITCEDIKYTTNNEFWQRKTLLEITMIVKYEKFMEGRLMICKADTKDSDKWQVTDTYIVEDRSSGRYHGWLNVKQDAWYCLYFKPKDASVQGSISKPWVYHDDYIEQKMEKYKTYVRFLVDHQTAILIGCLSFMASVLIWAIIGSFVPDTLCEVDEEPSKPFM